MLKSNISLKKAGVNNMEQFKVFIFSVIITLTVLSLIDSIRINQKNKSNKKSSLSTQELELSILLISIDRKDKKVNAGNKR